MTYKKFMSLFLIAGSIASTLCSCAATDSSAVVGYIDEHPITMEEFNYFLSQQKSSVSATLEAALFLFFRISNSRACQARELRKEKTRFCMMHSTAKRKPQNEKAD